MSNENAATTVRIYETTNQLVNKWRGKSSTGVFIDNAVKSYIRHELDNGDDIMKIRQALDELKQNSQTNLGLLCEVLRQAGILNGNGEVSFPKK